MAYIDGNGEVVIPPRNVERAVLAGGCFWCLEAAYNQLKGVQSVVSGFSGGDLENPSYEQVCKGDTGHAECVMISYRMDEISYETLLDVFFTIHDPTTLNRQGNDIGTEYRSAIFYTSDDQQEVAEKKIAELEESGVWQGIVTEIMPLRAFYPAEKYHQRYYEKNPEQAYCQIVINPKLAKLRDKHANLLKK